MARIGSLLVWTANYLPALGGAQWSTYRIARELQRQGTKVNILTRGDSDSIEVEHDSGLQVQRIAGPLDRWVTRSSAIVSRSHHRYDAVLVIDLFRARLDTQLATIDTLAQRGQATVFRSPTAGTITNLLRTTTERRHFCQMDAYLALNQDIATEYVEAGVDPERVASVVNAVDTAEFAPLDPANKRQARRLLGLPENAVIVIYAGRLAERKRLDVVCEAVLGCPGEQPLLLIVGAPGDEATERQVQEFARQHPGIRLLDATARVSDILPAADIAILISEREGQSNSLLEAMACELPVIASAIPGSQECVTDGASGYLVPAGDRLATIRALSTLIESPELRRTMGQTGRRFVERRHQLRSVGRDYQTAIRHGIDRAERRHALSNPLHTVKGERDEILLARD
jgi:glycosyltransferase involved in cell wall biosynthesis